MSGGTILKVEGYWGQRKKEIFEILVLKH